jgi:hypothetical protein
VSAGTRLGQVIHDVALLPAQRGHDRENPLHEAASFFALRPEAAFPVKYRRTHRSFCPVVRRLDSFGSSERPQSRCELEDHLTHSLGLGPSTLSPLPKEPLESASDRPHVDPEARSGQRSISNPAPKGEHLPALQCF